MPYALAPAPHQPRRPPPPTHTHTTTTTTHLVQRRLAASRGRVAADDGVAVVVIAQDRVPGDALQRGRRVDAHKRLLEEGVARGGQAAVVEVVLQGVGAGGMGIGEGRGEASTVMPSTQPGAGRLLLQAWERGARPTHPSADDEIGAPRSAHSPHQLSHGALVAAALPPPVAQLRQAERGGTGRVVGWAYAWGAGREQLSNAPRRCPCPHSPPEIVR